VEPITGLWLKEQTKLVILTVIETSQQQGVSARHSCSLLAIEPLSLPTSFFAFH